MTDALKSLRLAPGLVVRRLGREVVVYDPTTARSHALNPTAAIVFDACDGQTSVEAAAARIALETGVEADPALVLLAIAGLRDAGLLAATTSIAEIDRRTLMRHV